MEACALLPVEPGSHSQAEAPHSAIYTALQHCLSMATAICSNNACTWTWLLSKHAHGCISCYTDGLLHCRTWMEQHKLNFDAVWQRIEQLVVLSLISVQPLLQQNYR